MIPCQRNLFDIPESVSYLNCAYMSPLMRSVLEAESHGAGRKLRPWEIDSEDFFTHPEDLRAIASKLFRCTRDEVAILPSAGYGLSTAAWNLPIAPGQKILVLAEQFPSNLYPWRRLAEEKRAQVLTVPWPSNGDWTAAVLEHLGDDVAIAAFPHVQWTSGGMLDLARIGETCRQRGAALVLDLTQSLGVLPFDVGAVQPDFAVAATYKWLLGPYSLAVMYVAPKWHGGRPLEENWIQRANARKFSGLIHYTDEYDAGARRFDMGERSNLGLIAAAVKAMEQILAWGVADISETIGELNARLAQAAAGIGLSAWPSPHRAPHYLCLRGESTPPPGLAEKLAEQLVFVSVRGSSIRVTPHIYNSERDVERLTGVLKEVWKKKG
jgi:selenocysteine lyase/cysteine desulfurase